MNKRSTWVLLAVLMLAGCDEKAENTCGNGMLDADEICDGELIRSDLNAVCSNGVTPNVSAIKCTSSCTLDMSNACSTVCGNNVIEAGEQCDGVAMPMIKAGCSNPDMSKLHCDNCKIVNDGVCPDVVVEIPSNPGWYPQTCGNGVLDNNELCDGDLIRASAKICPENTIKLGNPVYKCLDSCRLVDISQACVPGNKTECNNGILEGDEQCDGELFSQEALENLTCGPNERVEAANAKCNANCEIESACVPNLRDDVGILITEVVPHLASSGMTISLDGFAVELTNMSKDAYDVSSCSLAMISSSAVEKKFPFSDMQLSQIKARESVVFCSFANGDKFNGACDYQVPDNGILNNLSGMAFLGIVCGEKDEIVDLFNLNSFLKGVEYGGVDFVRKCDAEPAKVSTEAGLSNGWADISSSTVDAPAYGLGEHCSGVGATVESCTYTISRNSLDNRGQSIDLALEINIPGITDKTDKTDKTSSVQLMFLSGEVRGTSVRESNIHMVYPNADMEWSNSDGIDRYVGKLRNWDLYDGFLSYDAGTYVLDASVSFDGGVTRVFCGPKGIVDKYDVYNPENRNTLTVAYDDDATRACGDGIMSSSEVCDGYTIREEALECEKAGEVIFDKSKVKCMCDSLSTLSACAEVPMTCGNSALDEKEGEVCDGEIVPDAVKVCPPKMVEIENAAWKCSSTCLAADYESACEVACGNNKLDASVGEVCDGGIIPESAKVCPKDYVLKDNTKWACNPKCDAVITDEACELACGNGKIDGNEVCDGESVSDELAAASCKAGSTYDSSRAICLDGCALDMSACIYDRPFVFDEFAVQYDSKGKAKGVAISVNLYGNEKFDIADTGCNLSILNERGSFAVKGAYYYSFSEIAGVPADAKHFELEPCKPLVICSEPVASEKEYEDIWGEHCDVVLGGFDENGKIIDNLLLNSAIDTLQISCGGLKVDYFDMAGLRAAMAQGYTHGKLKSSDKRPYAGRTTVELSKRMDLDKQLDLETFAKPVCE